MRKRLKLIYRRLYVYFGPQHWWPAKSRFEVVVGAILTQNTSWLNVTKAIKNIKQRNLLEAGKLYKLPQTELAGLIRPAGYYNVKSGRLKEFLRFFFDNYKLNFKKMSASGAGQLREELLAVKGIGPETADSILLYALAKPVFVVDAYTKRVLLRHGIIKEDFDYHRVQDLFTSNLGTDVKMFNEYHALLVKLAKNFCLKNKPKCELCPIKNC